MGTSNVRALTVSVFAMVGLASPAMAILNEFSVSDGYSGAFSTRVWTYNSLWSYDGPGTAPGSNYVAQHGYGSGFATTEPFGLVIRNDSPAMNYRFSYQFEPGDLCGINPASPGGQVLDFSFDVNGWFATGQSSGQARMEMAFGGTRANPGFRIGWSDNNLMMYSDASNNFIQSSINGVPTGWTRIFIRMDFANYTYDLSVGSMTGNTLNASNTWTVFQTVPVVTGMPFANITSMQNLWFEVWTDAAGQGWHKNFLDNFECVPTPGAPVLLGLGALWISRRRR
jgi:hypothetical protein